MKWRTQVTWLRLSLLHMPFIYHVLRTKSFTWDLKIFLSYLAKTSLRADDALIDDNLFFELLVSLNSVYFCQTLSVSIQWRQLLWLIMITSWSFDNYRLLRIDARFWSSNITWNRRVTQSLLHVDQLPRWCITKRIDLNAAAICLIKFVDHRKQIVICFLISLLFCSCDGRFIDFCTDALWLLIQQF